MRCTNPKTMPKVGTVPCNKCMPCRIRRTKEWSIRLLHESYNHENNIFVTLTYRDDNRPEEISKKEVQNFIKRLRKHLGEQRIKYYITGEYGESGHAHYHAIIFGLGIEQHARVKGKNNGYQIHGGPLCKAWDKGFIYAGTVTADSTQYVAGYIQKKLYGPLGKEKTQPFALQSNGLGKTWMEKNRPWLKNAKVVVHKGKSYPIPKYYVTKIDEGKEEKPFREELKMWNMHSHQLYQSHYETKYGNFYYEAEKRHRIQTNRNLNAEMALKENKL